MLKKRGSDFTKDILQQVNSNVQRQEELRAGASLVPTTKIGIAGYNDEITRRIPVLEVDPQLCEPWEYHNRDKVWLQNHCNDLIDSFRRVGQNEPVLLRVAKPGVGHKYDIIYGARRWYACKSIKGQKLLARITEAGDRECMILMHEENANSKDISKFERACSFKIQYDTGVFESQLDFAKAMNVSKTTISSMFIAAELLQQPWFNEFIVNKAVVSLKKALSIASELRNAAVANLVNTEVEQLRARLAEGAPKMTTEQFIDFLEEVIFCREGAKQKTIENIDAMSKYFSARLDKKHRLSLQILPEMKRPEADKLLQAVLDAYYA
jgi:ParB/RepB/Spo0J family partition protein